MFLLFYWTSLSPNYSFRSQRAVFHLDEASSPPALASVECDKFLVRPLCNGMFFNWLVLKNGTVSDKGNDSLTLESINVPKVHLRIRNSHA